MRELRGECPDPAEHAVYQHGRAGHWAVAEDRSVSGDPRDAEAGADLVAHRVGKTHGLVLGHDRCLRGGPKGAVRLRSEDPYPFADPRRLDALAYRFDGSCAIAVR